MAEPSTIARPYAEAVFKLADAAGRLREWSQMLAALAVVAQDERVLRAIRDPRLSDAKLAGLLISLRLPQHPIGRLLLGLGLVAAMTELLEGYGYHDTWRAALNAQWVSSWSSLRACSAGCCSIPGGA